MKTLIALIIGMILSVSSFSQNISKPLIIKDSSGLILYAFNITQINTIIKTLKENDINKKVIIQLQNQIALLEEDNQLLSSENDSLKANIKNYYEIKINLDQQVLVQKKIIDSLNLNATDYIDIENNYKNQISIYKQKIKRKNNTIIKLVATNVVTIVILVLVIH